MTRKVQWNSDALPYDQTLDQVLYEVRRSDAGESLLLDAVSPQDIIEDSDGALAFDALVTPYAKLERKMEVLQGVMVRSGESVKPVAMQVTEPFKQRGVANVAAIFELSDGQTVSIFFHNPDVTPNKMAASDEVISWKWLLNKKDITIVVAPERGEDLNIREVARRIIRLAEKNSPAFQRANTKRAERMQAIQGLKDEIAGLEKELATAQHELEVAKVAAESASVTPASAPASDEAATKTQGPLPWDGASANEETRWFGTTVKLTALDPKKRESGLLREGEAKLTHVINGGRALAVEFPSGARARLTITDQYIVEVVNLVDNNPAPSAEGLPAGVRPEAGAKARQEWDKYIAGDPADPSPSKSANILLAYWNAVGSLYGGAGVMPDQVGQLVRYIADTLANGAMNDMSFAGAVGRISRIALQLAERADADAPTDVTITARSWQAYANAARSLKKEMDQRFGLAGQSLYSAMMNLLELLFTSPDETLSKAFYAARDRYQKEIEEYQALSDKLSAEEDAEAEAEAQSEYTPFDPSQVKMPTAIQIGVKVRVNGGPKVRIRAGGVASGLVGWTNGEMLDLGALPGFVKKPLDEVWGGEYSTIEDARFDRVIADAKAGANVKVEPIANYDAEFADTSSTEAIQKGKKTPVNAFVLANNETGFAVNIDKRYYGYFAKTYKGCEFFAKDSSSALVVKKGGEVVGVVMPVRGAGAETLRRAMNAKAPVKKEEEAPVEQYPDNVVSVYAAKGGKTRMIITKNEGYPGLYSKDGDYGIGGLDTPEQIAKQVGYFKADFNSAKLVYGTPVEELPGPDAAKAADEPQGEADKIAAVDAAYPFASASDDFKLWLHESLEKPDYSPFVTAKAMDEAAKRHGATIEWGEFGGKPVMDSADGDFDEDDAEGFDENEIGGLFEAEEVALDGAIPPDLGPVFTEYKNDPEGAIERLMKEHTGDARAVWERAGLGTIDLIWGGPKGGLMHIAQDHPEIIQRLPRLIKTGKIMRKPGSSRAFLVGGGTPPEVVVLALDWYGAAKTWVVTGYDDKDGRFTGGLALIDTKTLDSSGMGCRSEDLRTGLILGHEGSESNSITFDGIDSDGYVGKVKKGGEVVGRIDIGGDGKAMVFVGASGDQRVAFPSGTEATYSDEDAAAMIDALFSTKAANAEPEAIEGPAKDRASALKMLTDTGMNVWMSEGQNKAVIAGLMGEEWQFFADKMKELAGVIAAMPKTYDQDGMGDSAVAHLHYFRGAADWYITEKDMEGKGTQQAFGLADLGYGGELGYISIEELISAGVELDFHFSPKTIGQIKGKGEPATQEAAPEVSPEDRQKQVDQALFQSVIDGNVPDILAPELADSLEAAYYRQQTDPALVSLFEQAVSAYQNAMMAATENL